VCGRRHRIAALLSHVIVDLDDPAFDLPTKPIGPFFSADAATKLAQARGWDITEDSGRGFRRVVASPEPKGFVEIDAIRCLLEVGPKVRAAVRFVRRGSSRVAVITTPRLVVGTLDSTDPSDLSVGTRIIHVENRRGALT
jgi:carbamate kinase